MEPVILPVEDFPLDHPRMKDVLQLIGRPEAFSISRQPKAPGGACYWAAREIAGSVGGELAFGWMLEWVPGVYVSALHHGVVKMPDGSYYDVTAPQEARSGEFTTFVPDDTFIPDLNYAVFEESRLLALVDDEDVEAAFAAYRESNSLDKWRRDLLKTVPGAVWSAYSEWALTDPTVPDPDLGDAPTRKKESYRALHTARQKILDRYF